MSSNPYAAPAARVADDPQGQEAPALWNPNAAACWSLIFTPAFGALLHMFNWRALGDEQKAATSKGWFIAALVLLGVYIALGVASLGGNQAAEYISQALGIGFLLAWYFAAAKGQARLVKERYGKDYPRKPWGKPLLLGIAFSFAFLAVSMVAGIVFSVAAQAAEIRVLSGNGARSAVSQLAAQFERASGHKVSIRFAVNVEVRRDIEAGAPFDAAILNPPVLDALIKGGKVAADSRTVLGRAGIGVGSKAGMPKPDISTVAAFKRTLLSSKAVAYPAEGASGKYFVSLLDRMGIAQEMKPKLKPMPAEYNVEVVASGEADLVVVVASRISGVPGVQLVGRIPDELQTWIGFTGGVASAAKAPEAARSLLRFFTTPEAGAVFRSVGIEPFVE